MWGVIAAWMICLASLSLHWPAVVLVVLLCCVAFFELASPAAWVAGARQNGGVNKQAVDSALEQGRRSPSTALAQAFHSVTERLRRGGSRRKTEELAMTRKGATAAAAASAAVGGAGKQSSSSTRTTAKVHNRSTFINFFVPKIVGNDLQQPQHQVSRRTSTYPCIMNTS